MDLDLHSACIIFNYVLLRWDSSGGIATRLCIRWPRTGIQLPARARDFFLHPASRPPPPSAYQQAPGTIPSRGKMAGA
jgi:hypothetical protein